MSLFSDTLSRLYNTVTSNQNLAGTTGKAIDTIGNTLGNILPDLNISESLESFGGAGGKFVLVPKVQAAEEDMTGNSDKTTTTTDNNSGDQKRYTELTTPGYSLNPAEQNELEQLKQKLAQTGISDAQINAAYSPIMDYLNSESSRISSYLPTVLQSAQDAYNVSKQTLDTSKSQSEASLAEQQVQAEQSRQSEENQNRQLYDQLTRAGMQRFGGATSAGGGYNALLGVEQQRSNAALAQSYQTAKREIQTAAYNLQQDYTNQLLTLQQQLKETQLNIRTEFEDRISQINSMKAETEGAKATAKLSALQDLQNKMYQLDLATMEYKSQLQSQAQSYASQLSSANDYWDNLISSGQSGLDTFSTTYAGSPTSDLSSVNSTGTNSGGLLSGLIGRIANKNDEDNTTNLLSGGGAG